MLKRQIIALTILFFVLTLLQFMSSKFFMLARYLMRFSLIFNFSLFIVLGFAIAKLVKNKNKSFLTILIFVGLSILVRLILSSLLTMNPVLGVDISFNLIGNFSFSDIVYLLDITAGLLGGVLLGNISLSKNTA